VPREWCGFAPTTTTTENDPRDGVQRSASPHAKRDADSLARPRRSALNVSVTVPLPLPATPPGLGAYLGDPETTTTAGALLPRILQ